MTMFRVVCLVGSDAWFFNTEESMRDFTWNNLMSDTSRKDAGITSYDEFTMAHFLSSKDGKYFICGDNTNTEQQGEMI